MDCNTDNAAGIFLDLADKNVADIPDDTCLDVCACGKTFLSDTILMALMGSTLADIIGILYIAVRWLFVSSVKH